MQRAYFSAVLSDFLKARDEEVLGQMAQRTEFPIDLTQRNAWAEQFQILREGLRGVGGHLFLEFVVPRIGSRVDAVVISGPVILAMEFKVGEAEFPCEEEECGADEDAEERAGAPEDHEGGGEEAEGSGRV